MGYYFHRSPPPRTEFGKKVENFLGGLIAKLCFLFYLSIPFILFGYAGGEIFGYRYRWGLIPTAMIWIYFYIRKKNKRDKELGVDVDSLIRRAKTDNGGKDNVK